MKHQIMISVAFFGGLYHFIKLVDDGANRLSLILVVLGTAYVVHSYKETSIPERLWREKQQRIREEKA